MQNIGVFFGCTGDIGKSFALQSACSYSHLVLIGRDPLKLANLTHDLQNLNHRVVVFTVLSDFSDSQSIAVIIDWLSIRFTTPLDIFYLAGQALPVTPIPFTDLSSSCLLNVFQVNLYAPIVLLSCLLASCRYFQHSRVFILGSSLTRSIQKGEAYAHAYASAKMALFGYVSCARDSLADHGIDVTLLQPGYIETRMTRSRGLIRKFGGSVSIESFSTLLTSVCRLDQNLAGKNIVNPAILF